MPTSRALRNLVLALLIAAGGLTACSDSESSSPDEGSSEPGDTAATAATDDGDRTDEAGSDGAASADRILELDDDGIIASLDPRYLSYNIEMVEVTGGEFWQPYDAGSGKVTRPPIDLGSERLRNLARGLGPAYIRVSGTWANHTFFAPDGEAGMDPPEGFDGVLTGDQWRGVGEFAEAVDALVMTSFAATDGVRDGDGVWQPDQAREILTFSADNGVPLVAAEFINEPSFPIGVPKGYDVDAYARDFEVFRDLLGEAAPEVRIVGPSAASDARNIIIDPTIRAEDVMERIGAVDVFSYHVYPKVSARCGSPDGPEIARDLDFLGLIDIDKEFYDDLRDRYAPDAPMWVTEIAQAACGGDEWAGTWRDVVRFVDTLGRIGDDDGTVLFHNTLAASDYGLLDERDLSPRPNYWAGVLWAKLMGPDVLRPAPADDAPEDLLVHAHCAVDSDATAWAVVNASESETRTVATGSGSATVHLLTGESDDGVEAFLNGTLLEVADDGTLPDLSGEPADGPVEIPAGAVAFIVEEGGPCS